jgi:hypothetical protein
MTGKPLNGTLTHPLTKHALSVLAMIARDPTPRQTVNPGVVDRLSRENLVADALLPSPYAIHKGGDIRFLRITDAGRARLSGTPGPEGT